MFHVLSPTMGMFLVTAPLRAPAFLHIFVASCCRRCAGVGGRGGWGGGGRGGNSAVKNASDSSFPRTGLCLRLLAPWSSRLSMMSFRARSTW